MGIGLLDVLYCWVCVLSTCLSLTVEGGLKKTGPFLRVDNFVRVNGRKACDMSKVC